MGQQISGNLVNVSSVVAVGTFEDYTNRNSDSQLVRFNTIEMSATFNKLEISIANLALQSDLGLLLGHYLRIEKV